MGVSIRTLVDRRLHNGGAERYGRILGDGEIELGKVNEPWGFAVMDLPGMDEIIAVCKRYAEILGGTLEIDVRLVE